MSFEFREARRANVPLLILIAGGTGAGKTESALRLATGLAGGKPFAVIDTERGRALHKADDYKFQHTNLDEPFTPERYAEAVRAASEAGFPVIVVDSGSHEYEGIGGVLDMQAEEFARMGSRESARMSSWIVPKTRHKKWVRELIRTPAHVVLCLRAEDKIEIVKQGDRTVVRPKESLTGAQGWIPICEKRLPFEATISLLVTADAPGVPKPIKLERRHAALIPLDRQIDESVGAALAAWAAGSSQGSGLVATMVGDAADSPPVAAAAGPGGLVPQPAGPDQRSGLEPSAVEGSTPPPVADESLGRAQPSSPDQRSGSVTGMVEETRTPPPVPAGDARGGSPQPSDPDVLAAEILEIAEARGVRENAEETIEKKRAEFADDPAALAEWLAWQLARARSIPQFQIPESART